MGTLLQRPKSYGAAWTCSPFSDAREYVQLIWLTWRLHRKPAGAVVGAADLARFPYRSVPALLRNALIRSHMVTTEAKYLAVCN